jgi:mannose-6-phosphate isomerase-like protein (cupin superfamily)
MDRLSKISLREKFDAFDERWSPKTVADVDEFAVKLVKIDGEFVWHHHAEADEVFLIVTGGIRMKYRIDSREDEVSFGPGELLRIPRGIEHMPIADPGTEVVLFERADLMNTGNVKSAKTAVPARV